MIQPIQSDEVFLADVSRPQAIGDDDFRLWWLGQSGFLVQWQSRHVLLDPYLSDSLSKKYAATDKPHVRMTARVVAPETLDFVDIVTSSHNHTDHLDAETLRPLRRASPTLCLVIPEANRAFVARRLECDPAWPIGLDDGISTKILGFTITGVPAAHEDLQTDREGRHHFLGYVAQFGPWTVYHSGDTLLYPGMVERLRPFGVDLALLPINGRNPARRVAGNLNGAQAARLAHDIGARMVIPCHYDMFPFNTASPDAFIAEAESLGQPYAILQNGEGWRSSRLEA